MPTAAGGGHAFRPANERGGRTGLAGTAANERREGRAHRARIPAGTMPAVPLGRGCPDGGPRGETLSPSLQPPTYHETRRTRRIHFPCGPNPPRWRLGGEGRSRRARCPPNPGPWMAQAPEAAD